MLFLHHHSLLTRRSQKLWKRLTAPTEHVFDTCRHYWVDNQPKFFWSCLDLSGTAIIFPKCVRNQKWKKFYTKKPFSTPNFWCRNFSQMHHFWVWIFFFFKHYHIFGMKNKNASKWILAKKWLKIEPKVIQRSVFGSFWHQIRSWFIIS